MDTSKNLNMDSCNSNGFIILPNVFNCNLPLGFGILATHKEIQAMYLAKTAIIREFHNLI